MTWSQYTVQKSGTHSTPLTGVCHCMQTNWRVWDGSGKPQGKAQLNCSDTEHSVGILLQETVGRLINVTVGETKRK